MMNLKHLFVVAFGAFVAPLVAQTAESVSITATSRYPWNGKVDLQFTIDGLSGIKYRPRFTARDVTGGTNVTVSTVYKSDGTLSGSAEWLLPGTYGWVWNVAADLGDTFVGEMNVTVNTTVQGFTVKFNANGGSGTMSNESFSYGTAKALTDNAFTRSGYTFQGWAKSSTGSVAYTNKQSVSNLTKTVGGTVTLYAVWKKK